MGRWGNFFLHGSFATDDMLGKKSIFSKKEKAVKDDTAKEPAKLEKGDGKAIIIAAIQVFGPILLIMLLVAFLLLYVTARFM